MNFIGAPELRAQFDDGFRVAPRAGLDAMASVLALRIEDDPYAVSLADLTGLARHETIVPLPSPSPALLGIVALRGAMLPVFDLGVLLGYARTLEPHWLLLAEKSGGLALAFEHFEAHVRLPAQLLVPGSVVTALGASRRLIDLNTVANSIRNHSYD